MVQNERYDKRGERTSVKFASEDLRGNVGRWKHLKFLQSISRKTIIAVLTLLGIIVFSVGGKAAYDKSQRNNIVNSALAIINQTSAVDQQLVQYGAVQKVSLGAVLSDMFENPKIDIKPSNGSFVIVNISGKFRRVPNQGYMETGSIEFSVNLKDKTCFIYSDPNGLYPDGLQFYALKMVGYY